MKRIAVLTSGGDSPGMNGIIRAIVRGAIFNKMEIYGVERGYEGLMLGEIKELAVSSVSDIIHRGGTMLRTSRSKDFQEVEGFKKALSMIETFGLEALIVIGGDGSFRGALDLSEHGIPTVCIPGTIDNDLAYTDFTIGFDTAVNTVLSAISNIRDTSSSHERTTVIEVMGRNCGDIALYSGLAGGAEIILVPEEEVDLNRVYKKLIQGKNRGKLHSIIMKAEGVDIPSDKLAAMIKEKTDLETKVVVLGYIQRGGTPTGRDRVWGSMMGYKAVELLRDNIINKAIGIKGSEIVYYDLKEALRVGREYNSSINGLADILSI